MRSCVEEQPLFAEDPEPSAGMIARPWKVLIVDDDKGIHAVTKLALNGNAFHGRPLAFLDAYSGQEAIRLMQEHDDVALVLMDVVMETETAGLDAAQKIRDELGNQLVRIAVRTGQPGVAGEEAVVKRYGIDDYREKTDLTATRLFTLVHTSLAHYDQLRTLERTRTGLRGVLDATTAVFQLQTLPAFADGVLRHLCDLLHGPEGFAVEQPADGQSWVIAASGSYAPLLGRDLGEIPESARQRVLQTLERCTGGFDAHYFSAYFHTADGDHLALYVSAGDTLITAEHLELAVLFCRNITAALENRHLERERDQAQREMVVTLSEAIEARSRETGDHVRRVAEYSRLLAQLAGLDSRNTHLLFLAAPLHDAGKIAIPDAVLHKPGVHTEAESAIMRSHAELGRQIFTDHNSPVLRAAAIVAGQHHERWDGGGYPNGLRGEDIHIFGRITAIADVFDALTHPRCYKEAWPLKRALEYLVSESGSRFDPSLVEVFMSHLDQFIAIHNRLNDTSAAVH